jgi:flagellar biosynthetic protein FlhB
MAGDNGQERTEDATPKRLQEARDKGQIARSREFSTMAVLLMAAAALLMTGDTIIESLLSIMQSQFSLEIMDIKNTDNISRKFLELSWTALVGLLPFIAIVFFVSVLSPVAIGGWIFSVQSFSFKPEKMDPIKGISRILSIKSIVELVKALLKFAIVLSVSVAILYGNLNEFYAVGSMDVRPAIAATSDILLWSFMIISSSMIIIALVDVPFQLWDHGRQLKMTRQEIKEEYKQTDGNPEQKRNIKERQREISQRRMMEDIPGADVIIINPTHYSVALRYDQEKMAAPIVVAKGKDLIAFQIRNIAKQHDVPIVSAPPLSRALYYSTEIRQEIPAGLFMTVAQVLAYIYRLKNGLESDVNEDSFKDMEIPEELKRDE